MCMCSCQQLVSSFFSIGGGFRLIMDCLKSAGLAGITVLGAGALAATYLLLQPPKPSSKRSRQKKQTTLQGDPKNGWVLFFDEEGSLCTNGVGHNVSECPLQECPVKHLRALKNLVSSAEKSVDVCLYNLTQRDLEGILVQLLRQNKRVRVVVGDRDEEERQFIKRLRSEGAFVAVKDFTPPINLSFKCSELLMHHKFVIVDDRLLITGSMNWTNSSFSQNYDHMIINLDKRLVQQFAEEFNYLFSTDNKDERCCVIRPQKNVPFQACFFRRNNITCRPDANRKKKCEREDCMFYVYKSILHHIISAKVSIDICVQQITVEDLSNELIFAHENGVNIRVIGESFMARGTGSQIRVFIKAGIPVRLQTGDGTLHHKFIIVDGKLVLSGSLNWTMQAFFGNYENVVLISQEGTVSRFQSEFNKLWDRFLPANE